ncbi:Acg family FMN-binding oxidoreductase [Actinoplanes palleronii]|uniref:NAD(P)H nitroreductase n=1 Tax=Actinoplanes palleronii TaxID=113570 RepID=A0ABQ4BFG1_9ACTN|nr:nitroreductase [Actinoplanes palleronii]GIE69342.1 NAD(P)H nitroreductase [Actinoplanes palleronii]
MSEVKQALVQAADAARFAPSIHNTQPWRWVVRADRLELFAVAGRQLQAQDPDARMLLLSCGAALHHAQVALDAEGWAYSVDRPAALTPDAPLAVITPGERRPAEPEATRHLQMLRVRRTDRRTVGEEAVSETVLDELVKATEQSGARLHVLGRDQVLELAVAVEHAQSAEAADDGARAELAAWVGGERPEGTGIPSASLPVEVPLTTVAERDFQTAGTVAAGGGHDRAATYAVLYGPGDAEQDWLRAGESLSRLWLSATEHAVSLLPFSGPVEVPFAREALRRILGGTGMPYLAIRLGLQDPAHTAPPHTPRLAADQVIDILEEG